MIQKILQNSNVAFKYISFILIFSLGVYAKSSGLIDEFIISFEDWQYLLKQNLFIVITSGLVSTFLGIMFAIIMTRKKILKYSQIAFQAFNILSAVPTLAILAIVMSFLGIGFNSAFFGLCTVTILPIVRNTYQGILEVPEHLIEAARGQGMTESQILLKVQIPNSLFVIFAGIRTGFALNVGTSPLITLIAADSLGEFIFTGIQLNDFNVLLIGTISVALLAITIDFAWSKLQLWIIPKGITPF